MENNNKNNLSTTFLGAGSKNLVDMTIDFFRLEAAGGILLVLAAILAMIVANSPLFPIYDYVLNGIDFRIGFSDGAGKDFQINKSVLHWINDGLMAVFFLLVGLEIKRELMMGELSGRARATLPALAAVGGMVVPAGIYYYINQSSPETLAGWAIPCATDIAFALGVLSLLGNRVPIALKILLTAVAIIDDLGAILIIAIFYTANLHVDILLLGIIPIVVLFLLNRFGVMTRAAYILVGFVLWVLVLKSGVHATMAGVITALFIPLSVPNKHEKKSPAQKMEHDLHPWVVFMILPLFAFANAGVPFNNIGFDSLTHPVTLGIILGLLVGKQIGVFGTIFLVIKSGLCPKPEGTNWLQLYAVSLLCGIGFTMSLFIGGLAFSSTELQAEVRLGVIVGSVISAIMAYGILTVSCKKPNA